MHNIAHFPAEAQIFISTARKIAALRTTARRKGEDTQYSIDALEGVLTTLAPLVEPDARIICEIILANCPKVLDTIMLAHAKGCYAMPGIHSDEMMEISAHIITSPEVEAATRFVDAGAVISLPAGSRPLIDVIIREDCPRRLSLLVAMRNQRPTFENDIIEVLKSAGLQTAKNLAQLQDDGVLDLCEIMSNTSLDEMTLKEFAWFIASSTDFDKYFIHHELEAIAPAEVVSLIAMTASNHGRLRLSELEPSLSALGAAEPWDTFFGLTSPDTHLLKDAKKKLGKEGCLEDNS